MTGAPLRFPPAQADLPVALDAARAAAELLSTFDRETLEVHQKSDGQTVTTADLAADDLLRRMLLRARPRYAWRSEESGDGEAGDADAPRWVIDPIDGTDAFLSGEADYTVCVGQLRSGRPVMGVVVNPFAGDLYYGVEEGGAFRVAPNGERQRVHAVRSTRADAPVVVVSSTEEASGAFAEWTDWTVRVASGTAWKMLQVASGLADGFCALGTRYEWDVCAPEVICAEAGCRVTDGAGTPLGYGRSDPSIHGVVAGHRSAHSILVERIGRSVRTRDRNQGQ